MIDPSYHMIVIMIMIMIMIPLAQRLKIPTSRQKLQGALEEQFDLFILQDFFEEVVLF